MRVNEFVNCFVRPRVQPARASSAVSEYVAGHMFGYADGIRNRLYSDRELPAHRRLALVRRTSLTFAAGYANGFASGQLVWWYEHIPADI